MMSDYATLAESFANAGQGHVFAFWDGLNSAEREQLRQQAAEIDLTEVAQLYDSLGRGTVAPLSLEGIEPAPYLARPENGGDPAVWQAARERGEAALRAGRVAAFTVAGGQGTRLGYDGPKGTFPVTPLTGKPLFQVFAEKLLAASRRYGQPIPWLIMTSHANHQATVEFFLQHGWFGLAPDQLRFFPQGRMPAVDFTGKILLESPSSLALSPDGHGGSLRALVRSGTTAWLREKGIDTVSYFQVDNPLVRCLDPEFIGFHLGSGAEMSSKMIPKAYPLEKLGHFCRQGGQTVVIEYSDLPASVQEERLPDGRLRFLAGSIAIHCLGVDFVERVGRGDAAFRLPFHRADKKIKTVDQTGQAIVPAKPNGIKFEMFVFDAIPYARDPVIVETWRADEFSPVKNATGVDSPATCRRDQLRQWARWLAAAGQSVPLDAEGTPAISFEISPLFADTQETFLQRWASLHQPPAVVNGLTLEPTPHP